MQTSTYRIVISQFTQHMINGKGILMQPRQTAFAERGALLITLMRLIMYTHRQKVRSQLKTLINPRKNIAGGTKKPQKRSTKPPSPRRNAGCLSLKWLAPEAVATVAGSRHRRSEGGHRKSTSRERRRSPEADIAAGGSSSPDL
ncbi:hypothetical protein L2E82_00376 [Cichorium intybus]|uniref:Uncharacterized protein n=1 Tax=Cichorium intybus TaxID=13427 RepID=A0ACB9GXD3_CICIN|nr:hypothetical protein L2E82_00376 [Cichorium intybus]